ncbi:MAG: ATP-dependent helicase C-terminal domain-containing protein, partial [Tumebacillaceae bacterium]
ILPWKKASQQLRERLHFMHEFSGDAEWPDVSDEGLLATMADWLAPHLYGMKSRGDLQGLNLVGIFEAMLTWEQRRELDEHAPTHLVVPSGSRIPLDYSDPSAPVLAVRLQEMFGLKETPRIAKRRVPVVLHLLSPAQRPVQVTRDLANFWEHTYFEVRKDLRGRYPKHYWPDDPLEAIPTHRAKPRT